MEYCVRIMDIPQLSVFQTHTRQDLGKTKDPPPNIVSLLEGI